MKKYTQLRHSEEGLVSISLQVRGARACGGRALAGRQAGACARMAPWSNDDSATPGCRPRLC